MDNQFTPSPDPLAGFNDAIITAPTITDVSRLKTRLQNTKGILDTERAKLLAAIEQREDDLVAYYTGATSRFDR